MTFTVDVQNQADFPVDLEWLQVAVTTTLAHCEAVAGSALTIVITDDDMVTRLNRRYRHVDTPTDVLSFPAESLPVEMAGESHYLGELVVAYPYAVSQAEREGHDVQESLALLVIHGTLHLLDYNHDTAASRAKMWSLQAEVLAALHISPEIVPALEKS